MRYDAEGSNWRIMGRRDLSHELALEQARVVSENGFLTEELQMFSRVPLRRMDGSTLAPTRISICAPRKILYPLLAVREDPVVTDAESDKMGGFQLIALHMRPCLFAS